MLSVAVRHEEIESLGPDGFHNKVVQYAYDSSLFCKNKMRSIRGLKLLLYGFELASGLKNCFDKSSVIVLDDNAQLQMEIASALNFRSGSFPITYLGVMLRRGKLVHEDWIPMLSKIDKRLDGWKGKILLRGADWCWLILVYLPCPCT